MEHINDFENYLRDNGKADKTIESYTGDVRGYIRFLTEKDINFDGELNRFAINSYKNQLLAKNYEPTTINKKLNSLQYFNIHLHESRKMKDSAALFFPRNWDMMGLETPSAKQKPL